MTNMSPPRQSKYVTMVAAWTGLLASETVAQLTLKAGGAALAGEPFGVGWLLHAVSSPWVLAGIAGYIGSFAAWMIILDRMALSLAFPLTAMVILVVTLASYLAFGEVLTFWRASGIAVILAGILLLGDDAS